MEAPLGSEQEQRAPAAEAGRVPLPSVARSVTLFEDRAEVVRVAEVPGAAGARWIAVGGVSLFIDERTVQARVVAPRSGPDADERRDAPLARVTAARVRWRAHPEAAIGREPVEALEREARDAAARVAAAARAVDRASRSEAQANRLLSKWAQALATAPRGGRKPDSIASWRASLQSLDEAAADALRALADARAEHAEAGEAHARAAARLQEAALGEPRYEALIEVEVDADDARPFALELTYRVACALWRPEHLARLAAAASPEGVAEVELVTWATAWQAAGEVWDSVVARFSTARPSRSASPPELSDDVLRMRRKSAVERSRVIVEAREQAILAAGLERGARAVDEMPGVDDGGEPLVFEARDRVTLPSDGRPLRVEIARRALSAEIALVLYPEVHPAAHLRATLTLADDAKPPRPLLAGPVRVARGRGLVGRARVDFVGAGEPFELGFGVDDAVRVRRTVEEETDTAAITGTRKIRRKIKVFLSNLSGDPKRIVVTERIPVSEVAEVEITLGDAPGFTLDGEDGLLRGRVELAPNATKTMKLSYEIRASSSVALPF